MEVIGIGNAGREICKIFEQKGYKAYSIDNHSDAFVKFPKVKTIEEAEKVEIDLSQLKNNIKSDHILCVMAGSGLITGACLRILENFRDKKIGYGTKNMVKGPAMTKGSRWIGGRQKGPFLET